MKRLIALFIAILFTFSFYQSAWAQNHGNPVAITDWEFMCTYKGIRHFYSPSSIKILDPLVYAITLLVEIPEDLQRAKNTQSIILIRVVDLTRKNYVTVLTVRILPNGRAVTVRGDQNIYDLDNDNEVDFTIGKTLVDWTKDQYADNETFKE